MMPILKNMEAQGELKVGEASQHPARNVLRSAIAGDHIDLIDEGVKHLYSGDTLLLATDGLLTLSEDEISSSIRQALIDNNDPAHSLINDVHIKEYSPQDNTTVTVIHCD